MSKTLCLDFDGVLHSYTSGWKGAEVILDPPTPGAIDFLRAVVRDGRFEIAIFSSRSGQTGGVDAMRHWLNAQGGLPVDWIDAHLKFPTDKPSAWVTLDDRSIQFSGHFPPPEELHSFEPWNRLVTPSLINPGITLEGRLPVEVALCLRTRTCLSLQTRLDALGRAAVGLIVADSRSKREAADKVDMFTYFVEESMASALQSPDVIKHFKR